MSQKKIKKNISKNIIYVPKLGKDEYTTNNNNNKLPKRIPVSLPFYYNLLIVVIWILIVYSVLQYIMALRYFKIYIDWWNGNGGKKYNQVFSIQLFAEFDSFSLGARFKSLFVSENARIKSNGAGNFIINMIVAYAKFNETDNIGFLNPSHFCESIVVGPPENYPKTKQDWLEKLKTWGGVANPSDQDIELWQSSEDNFFWTKYNINVNSPFIQSFIKGKIDQKMEPLGFLFAVGIDPSNGYSSLGINGGWWGFVRNGFETESNLTLETIYESLFATAPNIRPRQCNRTANILTNLGTSLISGLVTAAFLISNPVVAIGVGIAQFGVLAGVGIYQDNQKCA